MRLLGSKVEEKLILAFLVASGSMMSMILTPGATIVTFFLFLDVLIVAAAVLALPWAEVVAVS